MNKVFASALILGLTVSLTACSSAPARSVEIGMKDGRFTTAAVTVKAGEQIKFVLKNDDVIDHEFESDDAKIEEVTIPAGKSREVTWKAPAEAGKYEFICDAPGHDMEGDIVVE